MAPAQTKKGKGSSHSKAGPTTGGKRSHDQSTSGLTPESKRHSSKKRLYAEAAKGSLELVIVTKDDGHISAKHFNQINQAVEDAWIAALDKEEVPFTVEKWNYSNHFATVWVADVPSANIVGNVVEKHGFVLKKKQTVLEKRKQVTILSGLVQGPAAQRDRDILERFIKIEKVRSDIRGRFEFYQTVNTPTGKILKVLADEDAMLRLSQLDFEVCLGASGRVKLTDERAHTKTDPLSRKVELARVVKQMEEQKELLRALQQKRQELANVEVSSVGSLGLSSARLQEVMDLDENNEKAQPDEAGKDA